MNPRYEKEPVIPWWIWFGVILSILIVLFGDKMQKMQRETTLGEVVGILETHPESRVSQVTCTISGSLVIDKLVSINDQTVSYLTTDSKANVSVVRIFLPKGWKEIPCRVPLKWGDE